MTEQTAKKYFRYEPTTGKVYWKVSTGNSKEGKEVTTMTSSKDYYRVTVEGTEYMLHRVIFLLMGHSMPTVVDHINGDSKDNRWENLRDVTQQVNLCNRQKMKNNTSGVTGITWDKSRNKWKVTLSTKNLGRFDNLQDAIKCREAAITANIIYTDRHGQ